MTLVQRLLAIDNVLARLNNQDLDNEYKAILSHTGTKLYLKLNLFEKKVGLK